MAEFACKNKGALTGFTVLLALLLGFIDGWLEKDSNTTIQWIIFILAVVAIMYIQFIACVNEIEYEEEEYVAPSLQDKQVEELTEEEHPFHAFKMPQEYKTNKQEDGNGGIGRWHNPETNETKTVFILQPINITQEEFNEKINNNNIDMENKEPKKEITAPADPNIVIGYSLHNVHKKFRPMYNDICEFAINGGVKTEAEITAKLRLYGFTFTTERANKNTIAFNLDSSPKIRLPEAGYFWIK